MKASEQYFPVVLFITLFKVVFLNALAFLENFLETLYKNNLKTWNSCKCDQDVSGVFL